MWESILAPWGHEQGVCAPSTILWRESNYNSFWHKVVQAPLLVILGTTNATAGQEHH